MSKSTEAKIIDYDDLQPIKKTPYNKKKFPKDYEKNDQPSMTVPDQSMSLQELLVRFQRGMTLTGEKFPMYHGEDTPPEFKRMDLTEIAEYRKGLNETILAAKEKEIKARKEKDDKIAEQNQREQFKKWRDEEEKQGKIPNSSQTETK